MNILIIDDDVGSRIAAADTVSHLGHRPVGTGVSASDLSTTARERIDLALWRLPLQGQSPGDSNALRDVERRHPGVPVVTYALSPDSDLRAFVARLVTLAGSLLPQEHNGVEGASVRLGTRVSIEALEKEHIRRIVDTTKSLSEAASILGIDAATLYRKRKRYGIAV